MPKETTNVVMVGVWRMCPNKAVGCTLRGANNGKITTADEACQSTAGAVILPPPARSVLLQEEERSWSLVPA